MNGQIEIIKISKNRRKCKCIPACDEYFQINGFDIYCKKKLESLAFNILNVVNGTNKVQRNEYSEGWTTSMESQVINYINEYGVQNGTFSKLAIILGKTRSQVKGKVYMLERQGRLTYEKVAVKKMASDIRNGVL